MSGPSAQIRAGDSIGAFRVIAALGRGGMGAVFRAHDPNLRREVAVKLLLPLAGPPEQRSENRERFAREIEAMARVVHPNVVRIHGSGVHGEEPYVVLELVTGGSLDERLERGLVPWREACQLAAGVARGLEAIHAAGFVHRDLKPGNVLLDEEGRPKVADFGISKHRDAASLTKTGGWVGTPLYMAPEQAAGKAVAASDLYSLGCLLHALVAGRPPFEGPLLVLLGTHLFQAPPSFASRGVPVPGALEDLVAALLAKKPEDRPASARVVAERLEAIAVATGAEALPAPRARVRVARVAGAALVAGGVLAGVIVLLGPRRPSVEPGGPPAALPSTVPGGPTPPPAPGGPSTNHVPRTPKTWIALPEEGGETEHRQLVALGVIERVEGSAGEVVAVRRDGAVYLIPFAEGAGARMVLQVTLHRESPGLVKAALSPDGSRLAVRHADDPGRLGVFALGDGDGGVGQVEVAPGAEIVQFGITDGGRIFMACNGRWSGVKDETPRFLAVATAPPPGATTTARLEATPEEAATIHANARALVVAPPDGFAVARNSATLFASGELAQGVHFVIPDPRYAPNALAVAPGLVVTLWRRSSDGDSMDRWILTADSPGAEQASTLLPDKPAAIALSRSGATGVVASSRGKQSRIHAFTVRRSAGALALSLEREPLLDRLPEVRMLALSPDGAGLAIGTRAGGVLLVRR